MTVDGGAMRNRFSWTRWPSRQRTALVAILSVFAAAAIGWWALADPEFRVLRHGSAGELRVLEQRLRREGLSGRVLGSGTTARLEIPAVEFDAATRAMGTESASVTPSTLRAVERPLWDGGVFGVARDNAARDRQIIETAITNNPRIRSATFLPNEEKPEIFQPGTARKSAGISLVLEPGIERLSAAEARAIRDLISGALGIRDEEIQIVDQLGNSYGALRGDALDAEHEIRKKIEDIIYGFYVRPYEPWEFRLGVVVRTNGAATTVEEENNAYESHPLRLEIERDGDGAPSRQTSEEEVRPVQTKRTRTMRPAGLVESVRVDLRLDLAAVKRVLAARRKELLDQTPIAQDLERNVGEYLVEQKQLLVDLLENYPADVNVSAQILGTDGARESADTPIVSGPESYADSGRWLLVASSFGFVLFIVLVLRRQRRSRVREREAHLEPAPALAAMPTPECHGTLDLARRASDAVRARPEVAHSVLRFWMATSDSEEDARIATRTETIETVT